MALICTSDSSSLIVSSSPSHWRMQLLLTATKWQVCRACLNVCWPAHVCVRVCVCVMGLVMYSLAYYTWYVQGKIRAYFEVSVANVGC